MGHKGVYLYEQGVNVGYKGVYLYGQGVNVGYKGVYLYGQGVNVGYKGVYLYGQGIYLYGKDVSGGPILSVNPVGNGLWVSFKYWFFNQVFLFD